MMITCYIIDDEEHAIKSLLTYIEKAQSLTVMGYSQNPLEALSYFQQTNAYPDITFLDIDMPQISGLEVSGLLKGKTAIVFTTAHTDFAIEAFDVDASDYLLKPFSFQRFLKCVTKISDHIAGKNKKQGDGFFYIQTEVKGRLVKIAFQEIFYIESQKNYISIFTRNKKHLTYLTLAEMSEKLPPYFIRVNKSVIINTEKITNIEGNELFIENVQTGFVIGPGFKENFSIYIKDHLVKTKRLNH